MADSPDAAPATTTWSVGELSEAIGDRLRAAFPGEVWVRGEIHDLSRARSGHVYFTLRDADQDVTAQLSVMLSSTNKVRVNRLLLRGGGRVRMTDGTEVRIRGRLDWYGPRGQLQLQMTSIDPAFTLGQLAAARAELLERLRGEGLVGANALAPLPVAPLRIGLVTSAGSAAEADVVDELLRSGFAFEITRADVRVQGPEAPGALAGAITGLARTRVDIVLVARGGGAATDLAAFDSELVARAIAAAGKPVITGIGHEVDRSVADEVAHTAAKTPTAAAQHVVGLVAVALERAEHAWQRVAVRATQVLDRADDHLERSRGRAALAARTAAHREQGRIDEAAVRLARSSTSVLDAADRRLDESARRLVSTSRRRVDDAAARLDVLATRADLLDPVHVLSRGWSIARRDDGGIVRSVDDVVAGDALAIRVGDGTLHVRIERVDHDGGP
ncbi:MAG TPA: exodeoxyribonuclease VII large subunit [Acidimicrobiales bacterium]|nr:exodeoxyribonuclease VII large subunit [Acidimicrobiales bacterium]